MQNSTTPLQGPEMTLPINTRRFISKFGRDQLSESSKGDLPNRAAIDMSGPREIIDGAESDAASNAQDAPVHLFDTRIGLGRPEAEKDHDQNITDCEPVHQDTPDPGTMEGPPNKFRTGHVDDVLVASVERGYLTSHSPIKEHDCDH